MLTVLVAMLHKFGPATHQDTSHENAACLRHHLARAQTTKAIPMSVHPGCTNSGLTRKLWGFSRKRLCAGESHGACHLFAFARLCHRDKFRFLFAKCQALSCPVGLPLRPTCFSALWPTGLKLPCVRAVRAVFLPGYDLARRTSDCPIKKQPSTRGCPSVILVVNEPHGQ